MTKTKKQASAKDKGKDVAELAAQRQEASGSEDEYLPLTKRAKKSKKSGEEPRKKSGVELSTKRAEEPSKKGGVEQGKKKNTPQTRTATMNKMEFLQTRWADREFLNEIGILDDVVAIFQHMGLGGLFNMSCPSYKKESIQFLSSLKLYDDTALDIEDENRGTMSFKVDGKDYSFPIAQLNGIFGFQPGGTAYALKLDMDEAQGVWSDIAQGEYVKGSSKSSTIRHPAIRYAHTFLANTLFARREKGGVKEEELALLIEGIKPRLKKTAYGGDIIGQPKQINFGQFLARRLLNFREWVMTTKDTTPQIGIGGVITPILLTCGVTLQPIEGSTQIIRIDAQHLFNTRFITGRTRNSYGYKFKMGKEYKLMILPNQAATTTKVRENIIFKPKVFYLYNSSRDGVLTTLKAPRKVPQSEEENQPEEVYGSHRYDFEPYSGPITGEALRSAHEHIGLLQRFCKWQGKQLKKLFKGFKKQKKIIKELQRERAQGGPEEGVGSNMHIIISAAQQDEAGPSQGASQRKGKAPISPSTSGSGNLSYEMDSSNSDSN